MTTLGIAKQLLSELRKPIVKGIRANRDHLFPLDVFSPDSERYTSIMTMQNLDGSHHLHDRARVALSNDWRSRSEGRGHSVHPLRLRSSSIANSRAVHRSFWSRNFRRPREIVMLTAERVMRFPRRSPRATFRCPWDIAKYQQKRLKEGAAPKTINLELGTFRSITTRSGHWARLIPDIRMLEVDNDIGRSLTAAEADAVLEACSSSESRLLYPIVLLQLETGSRSGTVLKLPWGDVDFKGKGSAVGEGQDESGDQAHHPDQPARDGYARGLG